MCYQHMFAPFFKAQSKSLRHQRYKLYLVKVLSLECQSSRLFQIRDKRLKSWHGSSGNTSRQFVSKI